MIGVTLVSGCLRSAPNDEPQAIEPNEPPTLAEPNPAGVSNLIAPRPDQPNELGAVHWIRNLDEGKKVARQTDKPIFLLFTEVPGCSTVNGFAEGPLSHPLIVEAIEDEFVPVAIYNNTVAGHDRKVLNQYDEPSWNNPVVRFVDFAGKDIAPRYASGWTEHTLVPAMVRGLEGADRNVPGYLEVLERELTAEPRTTTFSMYCFWSGEVKLSALEGVISTRPGFAAGREVVDVVWDGRRTTLEGLARAARKSGAASGLVARTPAESRAAERAGLEAVESDAKTRYSAKDDKYQIRRSALAFVPMTPAQATLAIDSPPPMN